MKQTVITRELDHSNEIFRTIFSQSPVGIEIYGPEGLLIDANDACLKIFGVESVEEVRGFRLFEDPNLPDDAKTRLRDGETVQYESEFNFDVIRKMSLYRTSKTGKRYIDCFIKPLLTDNYALSGFIVHVMDITERKKNEESLVKIEKRYRRFLDSTTDISFLKDENFRYIIVNRAFTACQGKGWDEIIGKTDFDLGPRSVAETCRLSDIRALESEGVIISEEVAGGRILEARKFRVDMGNGKFGIGSLVRDITDQRRMEEAIEKSHQVLLNVLDGIEAVVYTADMKTYEVLYANKYLRNIFGDVTGRICWQTFQTGQTGPCSFCSNDKLLTPDGKPAAAYHWESRNTANGKWYDIRDRAIEWRDGRIVKLGMATDITELKEAEDILRCMSFVDDLTGLYNRRGFLTLAEQQLRTAHREKKALLLIFADLDNMKWINDSLGHLTGDRTLKDMAGILRETFRESDIIARVGGDEFVILAMEDPETGPSSLTRRLESRIDAYNAEKRLFTLSLSLGTTRYDPEDPTPLDELLNRADAMMYRQKHEKKKKG